jgi:hypothetical protein
VSHAVLHIEWPLFLQGLPEFIVDPTTIFVVNPAEPKPAVPTQLVGRQPEHSLALIGPADGIPGQAVLIGDVAEGTAQGTVFFFRRNLKGIPIGGKQFFITPTGGKKKGQKVVTRHFQQVAHVLYLHRKTGG